MMNFNNSKAQERIAAEIVILIVLAMVAGTIIPALL